MSYVPAQVPEIRNTEELHDYVREELHQVSKALSGQEILGLEPLGKEPSRVSDGMVVYADGSGWDPGSGAGPYARIGGGWRALIPPPNYDGRINVMDFGAVGTGEPSTDDRGDIQDAIDYATTFTDGVTRQGAIVYLPKGSYRITSGLMVNSLGLIIQGDGRRNTTLFYDNTAGNAIYFGINNIGCGVRDILIVCGGNKSTVGVPQVMTGGYAIYADAGNHGFMVNDVGMSNCYNGIYLGGTNSTINKVITDTFYGQYIVNDVGGGSMIYGNQFDTPIAGVPSFGSGFTAWATSQVVAVNQIRFANGCWFICTQAGTTAASGAGPTITGFFQDIVDGSAKWQFICSTVLSKIALVGTSAFVLDNDISGPCVNIVVFGGNGTNYVAGNTMDAAFGDAVVFVGATQFNHLVDNYIGTTFTGVGVKDITAASAPYNYVIGNNFNGTGKEAIIAKSVGWTIQRNNCFGVGNGGGGPFFGIVLAPTSTDNDVSHNYIPVNGANGNISIPLGCVGHIILANRIGGMALGDLSGAVVKYVAGNI